VQVAAEHAEGQGAAPRQDVEEGLLLGGVALEGAHVAEGDPQPPLAVDPDLADPPQPRHHQAAVAAGQAANLATGFLAHQLGGRLDGQLVDHVGQRLGRLRNPRHGYEFWRV